MCFQSGNHAGFFHDPAPKAASQEEKTMKYCQQCGAELPADASFCARCGYHVGPKPSQDMEAVMASADPEPVEPALPELGKEVAETLPTGEPPAVSSYAEPPPVPPSYGYGAPPPQQAPYPYETAHPQQPYAPPAPAPYPYAYGVPPQAPKRRKRWYIPLIIVLVVAGLLAGSWFVFGDQIRNLFSSPEKKWKQAEAASSLIPEDSMLYAIRETAADLLGQKKSGFVTDLTFDIKSDAMPEELAEILTLLSSLRLQLEARVDTSEDPAHFRTRVGLGKRGETGEALEVEIFNVGDYYILSLPDIFDKPLVLSADEMADMAGGQMDLFGMTGASDHLDILAGDKLDQMVGDLKDIFNKYAGKPEMVKGETLTVGNVSQVLDYYELVVPADSFPAMAKEILAYLRDHKGLEDLLTGLAGPVSMPGYEYNQSVYDGFLEEIEDAIDDISRNPGDYAIEARRKLYVDKKNKPVGEELTLIKHEGTTTEEVRLASLRVTDGQRHAHLLKLDTPDEIGLEYVTFFSMEGELRTGDFSVKVSETEWGAPASLTEVIKGTFSDFGLIKSGDTLYPVGKITFNLLGIDELAPEIPESLTISYEGRIESNAGLDHLIAKVELRLPVEDTPLSITIGVDHHALPDKEISFRNEMPADYYDLSDDDAMEKIMMDESVSQRLMEALEKLGINPEALGGFSGGGDWDDWDDDWDDWDDGD